MSSNPMYNILDKLKSIFVDDTAKPAEPATETVYEAVEARGSITEAVRSLESKYETFKEAKAKPDFLDVDKDGNKKESFKKAVKDKKVKETREFKTKDEFDSNAKPGDTYKTAKGTVTKTTKGIKHERGVGKEEKDELDESYTGRETKDGVWRVFKSGKAVAEAGPFKSAKEANAWISKQKKAVKESDASYSAKKASAGKDIGKPGKQFSKIAKDADKRYGSKERGEKVAGAVLKKLRTNESFEDKLELAREKAAAKGLTKDKAKDNKADVRTIKGKSYGGSAQKDTDEKDLDEARNYYGYDRVQLPDEPSLYWSGTGKEEMKEESSSIKGPHGYMDVERKNGVTTVKRREWDSASEKRTNVKGGTWFPKSNRHGEGEGTSVKTGSGVSSNFGTRRKSPAIEPDDYTEREDDIYENYRNYYGYDRVNLPDEPSLYWSGTGRLSNEYNELYNNLVPSSGKADTIEGEVLRAASKMYYRHYNDGDSFNQASFDQLEPYIGTVKSYDDLAEKATEFALKANGNYTPNPNWDSLDAMEYGPEDEGDDDWDDEEDYEDPNGWEDDDDLEEGFEDKLAQAREKAAAKGLTKDKPKASGPVRTIKGKSYGGSAQKDTEEKELDEVAPPGAKAERMVKHIKKGYADDGKLTKREKGIAYATAWKAHNKGQVEEGVEFGDKIKNSQAKLTKAKPAKLKESRMMEETDYFYERVAKALAEKNPNLDTQYGAGEFEMAVRKEMVAQGMDPNRARNILLQDEDFLGDVATSYNHYCKEMAPAMEPAGLDTELDEIARLAGLPKANKFEDELAPTIPAPEPMVLEDELEEEEVGEGNEFSGALAKAKAAGAKEFEVDGKKYTVKEDVTLMADGDDVVDLIRKLAGMDTEETEPAVGVTAPIVTPADIDALSYDSEEEVAEERDIEYVNTPREQTADLNAAIPSGNDLHRAKKSYSDKPYRGDNPMAVKEDALWKSYESMLKDVKEK